MSMDEYEGGLPHGEGSALGSVVGPISNFLSDEEILKLPEDARVKIHEWTAEIRSNVSNVLSEKGIAN